MKVTGVETEKIPNLRHFESKMFKNKLNSYERMDQLINVIDDSSLKITVI